MLSTVAPFAGAWIEIPRARADSGTGSVAPFAGAWIEIAASGRACRDAGVAPFAGAWIEMLVAESDKLGEARRSLRGSVD